MNADDMKAGVRVRVNKKLRKDTKGILIKQCHLDVRKVGVTGTLTNHVPGHGGDVWFVQHEASEAVGAYCYDELDKL